MESKDETKTKIEIQTSQEETKIEQKETNCDTTNAVCDTTNIVCDTINADCDTTNAVCDTTNADCDTTNANCDTTNADCDTTNADCCDSIFDSGFEPSMLLCKASIVDLVNAIDYTLKETDKDSYRQKRYKQEWSRLINNILQTLNRIYTKCYAEIGSDGYLFYDVFIENWNWRYNKLTLEKASFFMLMKTLIRCLREIHTYIKLGGNERRQWKYQQTMTMEFDKLVDKLGEKNIQKIKSKNKEGKEYIKTIVKEPIIERLNETILIVKIEDRKQQIAQSKTRLMKQSDDSKNGWQRKTKKGRKSKTSKDINNRKFSSRTEEERGDDGDSIWELSSQLVVEQGRFIPDGAYLYRGRVYIPSNEKTLQKKENSTEAQSLSKYILWNP